MSVYKTREQLKQSIEQEDASIDNKIYCVSRLTPYNKLDLISKFELVMINYISNDNATPHTKCCKINDYDNLVFRKNYPMLQETMINYQYACICEYYWESYSLAQRTNDFNVLVSSASVLLNIRHIQQDRWQIISDNMVRIFNDPTTPHTQKSDVADLLVRTRGCGEAMLVIVRNWLGTQIVGITHIKNTSTTVYDSGQNVHTTGLTESNRKVLDKFANDKIDETNEDYGSPYKTIASIKRLFAPLTSDAIKIKESLDRICVDTATFHGGFRLRDVLQHVYYRILNHKEKDELIKRLKEELIDSSGYCSSGHLTRLINVLSVFDDDVSGGFGYIEEIYATLVKRFTVLIEKQPDGDVIMDSLSKVTNDDKAQTFFESCKQQLIDEIFDEYNKTDMKMCEFIQFFNTAIGKLGLS